MANQTDLPANIPLCEEFDGEEYSTRQAFTIGELAPHLRAAALRKAEKVLGVQALELNTPIYESAGLTKTEAERDGRSFLRYLAADLPLDYFWHQ